MCDSFLPLAKPNIEQSDLDAALEVLKSGWWTTGPKVTEFEQALCGYLHEGEQLHAVGLNSCTSALHLALLALDIGPGDEVVVPTWTFAATAQVVEWVGATLVLCDVCPDTLNIDLKKAEELITPNTKAIIPVHMFGYPCDMDALATLAQKHHLKIIEDAAHAIGTKYKDKKIGNFSDVTCFSFYATKNLAMGEGGAAVSKDPEVIEKIRKLGYFGINKEAFKRYEKGGTWLYDIEELGYKCNLDSVHAALGLSQLARLDSLNERRREIAVRYKRELDSRLEYLEDDPTHYHIYHLFPILLPAGVDRNSFSVALREKNIGSSVHFVPLHQHSYYASKYTADEFPVANAAFERILSIPMFPSMTDEDVLDVIKTINALLSQEKI